MGAPPSASTPPDLPPPDPRAFAIKEVIAREGQQIRALCARRNVRDRLNPIVPPGEKQPGESTAPERFGLAFSGGGIRSAAVNLGLIQALARTGFLRQAHYISGVSGGGYILGWLTAWTAHVGFDAVEDQLSANSAWPNSQLPARPGFRRYLEPNPIHYLRQYVSYLVPRSGLGSGDTLVAIAIYLRNVLLIQTMLATALIGIFALMQMAAPSLIWPRLAQGFGHVGFVIAADVLLVALALPVWIALGLLARNVDPALRKYWAAIARVCGFFLCVVLWLGLPAYVRNHPTGLDGLLKPACWIAGFFLLEFFVTLFQTVELGGNEMLQGVKPQDVPWARILTAIVAGIFAAAIIAAFRIWLLHGDPSTVCISYVVLGLPALLLATALISFAYVGIFGDAFPDAKREWLGRLAGYFMFFGVIAGIVLFVTLLGPFCVHWIFGIQHAGWKGAITKWVLPGGWIATTVGGLFAARSSKTGKSATDGSSAPMEALAAIAPPVFLLGLMLLLSWGTHSLTMHLRSGEYLIFPNTAVISSPPPAPPTFCCCTPPPPAQVPQPSLDPIALQHPFEALGLLALISLFFASLLGWRVSVNEFSLNLFYRNRLVRTFLGASNINARTGRSMRKPDPFTGFTLDDDHYLGSLRQGKFDGPYPMWCAALNLTGGEDLAWQKRKASSFLYSPMFCGWDYMPSPSSRIKGNAYREVAACTEEGVSNGEGYGGKGGAPLIGTAMAASGAAISPNWGFHTKPSIAALLAVFNVRIGLWAGNPLDPEGYKKYAPGIGYFLNELLGSANEQKQYVYLSDGGNFENLGLYELVRRRVKYIIVCDADADPTYDFGDFSNAVEKCRVDFGVQIDMGEYSKIVPNKKTSLSATHFAVGKIRYLPQTFAEATQHHTEPGILLYIKSSITGDEPPQVLGQRSAESLFPHDETLNQFFNETQFEAYRALGEHMGTTLTEDLYESFLKAPPATPPQDMSRDQRAEYVRAFFESFLNAVWDNKASLIHPNPDNGSAPPEPAATAQPQAAS